MTSRNKLAAQARAAAAEDRESIRTALLEERRGYVQRGLDERAAQVNRQLDALDDKPSGTDLADDLEHEQDSAPVNLAKPAVKATEAANAAEAATKATPLAPAAPDAPVKKAGTK